MREGSKLGPVNVVDSYLGQLSESLKEVKRLRNGNPCREKDYMSRLILPYLGLVEQSVSVD